MSAPSYRDETGLLLACAHVAVAGSLRRLERLRARLQRSEERMQRAGERLRSAGLHLDRSRACLLLAR